MEKEGLKINDFVEHCSIRISSNIGNGIFSTGTGFFYTYEIDGEKIPVIVTNKHVIKDAKETTLVFSSIDDENMISTQLITKVITNIENRSIFLKEDIDLAIIPLSRDVLDYNEKHLRPFFSTLSKENIPSDEYSKNHLESLEDIIVVGYPDGIWDEYNNIPVVRKGITATPIMKDFSGRKEFLVDCSIFPGSSGSPVMIYNRGSFPDKNELVAGDRLLLIGIIYGCFNHTISGEVKMINIPTSSVVGVLSSIPNNLGIAIKASCLDLFVPALKEKIKPAIYIDYTQYCS